jgi:hypothetical protein
VLKVRLSDRQVSRTDSGALVPYLACLPRLIALRA